MEFKIGDKVKYKEDGVVGEIVRIDAYGNLAIKSEQYGVCTEIPDDIELVNKNTIPEDVWVRTRDYAGNEEIKIHFPKRQDFCEGWYKSVCTWKPKRGEWVWCRKQFAQFTSDNSEFRGKNLLFKTADGKLLFEKDFSECEPFIGTYPTFLKENDD